MSEKEPRYKTVEELTNEVKSRSPCLCHFCGGQITELEGRESGSFILHSLDGNHKNWTPENKVPAHRDCHIIYHQTGKTVSRETRRKVSLSLRRRHYLKQWREGEKEEEKKFDGFWKSPPKTFDEVLERLNLKWMYEDNPIEIRKPKKDDEGKET